MLEPKTVAIGLIPAAQSAIADKREKPLGIWKLLSVEIEFQDGSPRRPSYGQNPTGYLIFAGQGRMMAVLEGDERTPARTDEERAVLFRTMFAYTGMYR